MPSAPVRLSVGGKVFWATRHTLSAYKGSFLDQLLTTSLSVECGIHQDFIIHRDPTFFGTILNFLRDLAGGHDFLFSEKWAAELSSMSCEDLDCLLTEADYYCIDPLVQLVSRPVLFVDASNQKEKTKPWLYGSVTAAVVSAKSPSGKCRIVVRPGSYRENILPRTVRDVEIVGDPGYPPQMMELYAVTGNVVFAPEGSTMLLQNLFLLKKHNGKSSRSNGIVCDNARVSVRGCVVSSYEMAAFAARGDNCHVDLTDCIFTKLSSGAIVLADGANGVVENCTIFGAGLQGIEIRSALAPILRKNRIINCRQNGIFVHGISGGRYENNSLQFNCLGGLMITGTAVTPTISGNTFHGNHAGIVFDKDVVLGNMDFVKANDFTASIDEDVSRRPATVTIRSYA